MTRLLIATQLNFLYLGIFFPKNTSTFFKWVFFAKKMHKLFFIFGYFLAKKIHQLMTRVDEMNEKLYEFETNKKNNLIFYGIPGETRETPPVLMTKVGGTKKP